MKNERKGIFYVMKWRHHSFLAASAAILSGMSFAEAFYCACFANLPDQIESVGRVRIFRHRTWTHDLALWGGACACLFLLAKRGIIPDNIIIRTWAIPLPGVMHILGDILTPGGVRFLGLKICFPLFKTGSVAEWLFVMLVGLAALFVAGSTYADRLLK